MVIYNFFILAVFLTLFSVSANSADTIIIRDTVYVFDSTNAVATSVAELKAEFYERAIQGLERERSSTNILITLIGTIIVLLTSATGYAAYSAKKSREEVDREIDRIKGQRDTIDREVAATRELRIIVEKDTGSIRDKTDEIRNKLEKESEEIHGELKTFRSEIDVTKTKLDKVIEEKTGKFDELLQSVERSSKEMEEKTEAAKKQKPVSPEKIAELIESSDAKILIDEYEQIVAKYLEIDELQSLPSKLHKTAGMSYLHQKKYKEALFAFQRFLYILPGDTEANFQCAFCFDQLSQFDEAIRYNSVVVISDPDNLLGYKSFALSNWGLALGDLFDIRRDEKLLEQAIEKFREAIGVYTMNHSAYVGWSFALIKLYSVRNDAALLNNAIEKCRIALDFNPEFADAHFNSACAYSLLGQKEQMLSALERAINLDSKYKSMALEDEDFEAYKDDPDFLALVKPSKDDKKSKDKSKRKSKK